jgi:fructose-specific component phosphotransferase system IIB-like protein
MVVKNSEVPLVVQKLADEGTTSPFIARVFYGPLRFRDQVLLDQSKRLEFDAAHNFVLTELMNARTTAQEILKTVSDHMRKISERSIVRVHGQTLHIDENIDLQLGKQVEDFINGIARSLKHGMQTLAKALGTDIGFLFQKADAFTNGLAAIEKSDPFLADYMKQTRSWSERLMECRNAIEHKGWKLAKIKYSSNGGTVRAYEPEVSGEKLADFVKCILDRVICFAEDVTMHTLQVHMPPGISITEIGLSKRDPEIPLRFQVALASGGMPTWHIRYHQSSFEET